MKITDVPKFTRVAIIFKGIGYVKTNVDYEKSNPADRRCLLIYDGHPSDIDIKRLSFIAETLHVPNLSEVLGGLSIEVFAGLCISSFCSSEKRVELIG